MYVCMYVVSFGVSTDISFELALLDRTSCHVFAYDPTVSDLPIPENAEQYRKRITFEQKGLAAESSDKDNMRTIEVCCMICDV